jgi:hypothetical protein
MELRVKDTYVVTNHFDTRCFHNLKEATDFIAIRDGYVITSVAGLMRDNNKLNAAIVEMTHEWILETKWVCGAAWVMASAWLSKSCFEPLDLNLLLGGAICAGLSLPFCAIAITQIGRLTRQVSNATQTDDLDPALRQFRNA